MSAPFVISMRATFDGSQAKSGAADVKREVLGIGQAANQARGPLAEMMRAVTAQRVNQAAGVRDEFDTARRQADIEAYGRELDELRSKFSPLFAAEQRYAAITSEIARARQVGAITAAEESAALAREKAAYDQLTASLSANSNVRARNQQLGAAHFNGANAAAQLQDIIVTAQMGMSWQQIALQQGTQLSMAFSGAGGAAGVLRSAVMSLLNPMSLLTIGAVGLGAAGLQAFMGMVDGAEDATSALEEHEKWLDKILHGYDATRQAAQKAAEESGRLPQGAAAAGAGISYTTAQTNFLSQLERAAAKQDELNFKMSEWQRLRQESARQFPDDLDRLARFDELGTFAEELLKTRLGVHATAAEINDFVASAYRLKAAATDGATRQLADDMIAAGDALLAARGQADGAYAAILHLASLSPVQIAVDVGLKGYDDAIAALQQLAPDLRSAREKASEELNKGLAAADAVPGGGTGLRARVYEQYNATLEALDQQDAQREAERAARESERLSKQVSDYDRAIEGIRQRTASQEGEARVVGLSAFAAEKYRMQLELEAAARKDAIGLTPQRIAQIDQESSAYARAAAEQEALLAAERARTEQMDFYRGTFRSFVTDVFGNLRKGEDGWKAFANAGVGALDRIANRALGMAADGIFDLIFGAISGGLSGGATGGVLGKGLWGSAIFNMPGNARGTDNWRGGVTRINEEGGEIINLPRGSQVIPHDVSMEMARAGTGGDVFNITSTVVVEGNGDSAQLQQVLDQRDRALIEQVKRALPNQVRYMLNNPRREHLPG